jgi:outer membrane protein OmpA-like peptidoglycan-associated protein
MRTLAVKEPSNTQRKQAEVNRVVVQPSHRSLSSGVLQRKSSCACGGGCPRCQEQALLQTKLKISEPGDQYEQEADRIADEVMRMPEPSVQRQIEPEEEEEEEEGMVQREIANPITPLVQREVLPEMEEEEEEGMVQTKAIANQVAPLAQEQESSEVPPIVQEVLNSPGQPLDPDTRIFMESRFGHNFSQVRVHTSAKAAESAQSVNASAYTVKRDIVFGAEQYAPEKTEGRKLLAHELTHFVQQRNAELHPGSSVLNTAKTSDERPAKLKASSIESTTAFVSPMQRKGQGEMLQAKAKHKGKKQDLEQEVSWVKLDASDGHIASIYFATNQATLDNQDKSVLNKVYNAYQKMLSLRKVTLLFIGYADYRGGEKDNLSLGQQRAQIVSEHFSPLRTYSPNFAWGVSSAGESELPQIGSTSRELSPYRQVDIIADPIIRKVVQQSKRTGAGCLNCRPYCSYDKSADLGSYNCAGLAHRTYDDKNPAQTKAALAKGSNIVCSEPCAHVGMVKHWLWEFTRHAEDYNGNVLKRPITGAEIPPWPDFHTVAGPTDGDPYPHDSEEFYSKDGHRSVHGPGKGPSFRPLPRGRLLEYNPDEKPVSDDKGQPVYYVNSNITESCYCLPCPKPSSTKLKEKKNPSGRDKPRLARKP